MQIHFLELPKVEKIREESGTENNDILQLWMQLFKAKSKEELEMLETVPVEAIQTGVHVIYDLSEDEQIRKRVQQREKEEQDYYSDMAHAKAEGKAETYKELIANWKAQGMTDEEICRLLP